MKIQVPFLNGASNISSTHVYQRNVAANGQVQRSIGKAIKILVYCRLNREL